MRDIKQILRGDFPGEDVKEQWYKCCKCGYAQRVANICPMCRSKELTTI